MDGNYSLTVNDLKKAVLQASFIGYNTIEESVKGRSTVEIKLSPSVVNLGEVVAIGYGTQTRREITGSVANVSEESFNKGITRDASDLLQGKVAGLTITSGSGDVTRGSTMRLRGTSTLQNDQGPLIVIDGIPGGDMSTVAPSDIESISVLKDASSAAIYGSRAAGGVVLITTKRGSGSKTQISYDGYVAFDQMANKPDLMNADEWRGYANSKGLDYSVYDQYGADTDWFDELTKVAVSHSHTLQVMGGNTKTNYKATVDYKNTDGIDLRSERQQVGARLSLNHTGKSDLYNVILNVAPRTVKYQDADYDTFRSALLINPTIPVMDPEQPGKYTQITTYSTNNPVEILKLEKSGGERTILSWDGTFKLNLFPLLCRDKNHYLSTQITLAQ